MADFATTYREAQGRVMSLVNNQNAATPVPACPGWSVKDVISHLAGVLDDHRTGTFEGAPGPEWTNAQVEKRRSRSLADIGAEWHLLSHTHPRILASDYGHIYTADVISHEFDIRGAIGNQEGRTLPGTRTAALFFLNAVKHRLKQDGLPSLRIQVEDKMFTVGDGEPAGTVTLPWFELLRTLSGRRSSAQVRALPWEGDPDIWLEHLFIFGPAEHDVVE